MFTDRHYSILFQTIPTIEADEVGEESFLGLSAEMTEETEEEEDSLPEPVDRKNQEELINRLMTDGMSFSEVVDVYNTSVFVYALAWFG